MIPLRSTERVYSKSVATGALSRAYTSTKSAIGLASEAEAASAVTNAAFGGLIGTRFGAALNDEDRRLAYEAQILALDRGAPGAENAVG